MLIQASLSFHTDESRFLSENLWGMIVCVYLKRHKHLSSTIISSRPNSKPVHLLKPFKYSAYCSLLMWTKKIIIKKREGSDSSQKRSSLSHIANKEYMLSMKVTIKTEVVISRALIIHRNLVQQYHSFRMF